jgi:hypothetical protein
MTPSHRHWILRILALSALLAVGACNIFNPSGTGDVTNTTADDWIQSGQEDLRSLRFQDAYNAFSTALAIDSGKSLAWHGLAKATMGKDSFNLAKVVDIADTLSKVPDSKKLDVLLGLGDTGITRLYRPLMRVASIYERFHARDSAGKTDKKFGSNLILNELTTIRNNRSYFLLIDANRDTVIQKGELSGLKMMSMATGNLELSATKLIAQGGLDTSTGKLPDSTRDNINGILNNVTSITSDTNILNQLINSASGSVGATGASTGDSKATAEINAQAKSFIQKLGSSTSFFLINDSLDNDGDGCINEEMFGDSLDNDGDGLKDEDGRVGIRKIYKATPDSLGMLTPPDGYRHNALQIVTVGGTKKLAAIPTTTDPLKAAKGVPLSDELQTLTYQDNTGLTKLFKGLRWVSYSDPTVGNDTIWTRIVKENGYKTPKDIPSNSFEEIKTLGIIEVRKKVLATTDITARIALGKKIVGGCWDNVK